MTMQNSAAGIPTGHTQASTTVQQGMRVSTEREPTSSIACREIEDWCGDCRKYRPSTPPIFTSTSVLAIALGVLAGSGPALAAVPRSTHGVWWGIFLLASIIAAVIAIGCLGAIVFRKKEPDETPPLLEALAGRMERASHENRVKNPQVADTAVSRP